MNQEDFIYDRKPIMVATNAFGMGIDKSNVSFVFHYNMPKNIESYYQEAGRCGRDGSEGKCIMLYSPQDVTVNRLLITNSEPNQELDEEMQNEIREKDFERLKYMTYYATTTDCLRSFILKYFGEKTTNFCGKCSNCEVGYENVDITIEAQKILSAIIRTGQRYGAMLITDVLKGSKNAKVSSFRLDQQSTYGIMADLSRVQIRNIMDELILQEFIKVTDSKFPVLMCLPKATDVLKGNAKVFMKVLITEEKEVKEEKKVVEENTVFDLDLFDRLKKLRFKLASQAHVPAYIIFTDDSLKDMCRKLPRTVDDFLEVRGVGRAKLEKYGDEFLEEISKYA